MRIEAEEREQRERMRELAREQVVRAEAQRDAALELEGGEGELEGVRDAD